MKYNTRQWLNQTAMDKKAMPILSFPCISLLGITVKELISDSTKQAEGMLKIAEEVPSAASVSLMDLSVEAECFGAKVQFSDNEVPAIKGRLINTPDEAEELKVPAVGTARSGIYVDAIKKAKDLITDRPVFAGIIGPFSLAARLFDVTEVMFDCYDDPDMVHIVTEKATDFLIEYAKSYKDAGADGIVMAEPVAGLLSPSLEEEFSSPYVKKIVDAVQDESFAVIYHNCGDNVLYMLDSILKTGAVAYHFGNSIDMKEALEKLPDDTFVMGNLDPVGMLRFGTPEAVHSATEELLKLTEVKSNFIISSGCDIPPETPWENIRAFFETVKNYVDK